MSPITQTPIPLSDEWATPRHLFDTWQREFHFTLDACAKPWNAKCPAFLPPTNACIGCGGHGPCDACDGLKRSWGGYRVWCNPPYSDIGAWVEKAYRETRKTCFLVVLPLPVVPDRKWWSAWVEGKADEVRLLTRAVLPSGRIHFEKEDGTSGRAPFPSCLVVYKRDYSNTYEVGSGHAYP